MLANALRWAIELEARTGTDDYAFQREQRLRQLEDELTILREHVRGAQTKTRHVMNLLLIEYARRRHADRAIHGFQERLSARRHRYADRLAEFLRKLVGPFRRRPAPAPAPANSPAPPKRSSPECAVS